MAVFPASVLFKMKPTSLTESLQALDDKNNTHSNRESSGQGRGWGDVTFWFQLVLKNACAQ